MKRRHVRTCATPAEGRAKRIANLRRGAPVKAVETLPGTVLAARREEQLEDVADSLSRALRESQATYRAIGRRIGRDVNRTLWSAMRGNDVSVRTLADVATALGLRVRVSFERAAQ